MRKTQVRSPRKRENHQAQARRTDRSRADKTFVKLMDWRLPGPIGRPRRLVLPPGVFVSVPGRSESFDRPLGQRISTRSIRSALPTPISSLGSFVEA